MTTPEEIEWTHARPNLWRADVKGVPCEVERVSALHDKWEYRVGDQHVPFNAGGVRSARGGESPSRKDAQAQCLRWVRENDWQQESV